MSSSDTGWHLSTPHNILFPSQKGGKRSTSIIPEGHLQQESGLPVGAGFDWGISGKKNQVIFLFSEPSPHSKGTQKSSRDHHQGKLFYPGSAGAASKGDGRGPVKVSPSIYMSFLMEMMQAPLLSTSPARAIFISCMHTLTSQ